MHEGIRVTGFAPVTTKLLPTDRDSRTTPPRVKAAVRVGAVSYLNTKPLVYGLAQQPADIDLVYDLPSRLADRLHQGELDVALIPSIEYLRHPEYRIVSDACIGCQGPVLSVKLLSRGPMDRIRVLALDEGSRSSAVMVQILLKAKFGVAPQLQLLPHDAALQDATADAVLLIGDRAIHPPASGYQEIWDLGDQWCRWSGLPFVFAMWVARSDREIGSIAAHLSAARDAGMQNLDSIARVEGPRVGLTCEQTLRYLRDNLHFYLGNAERRGLERFRCCADELDMHRPVGERIT